MECIDDNVLKVFYYFKILYFLITFHYFKNGRHQQNTCQELWQGGKAKLRNRSDCKENICTNIVYKWYKFFRSEHNCEEIFETSNFLRMCILIKIKFVINCLLINS